MRLRQIALVARDLRPVETEICDTLGLEVCFRDPGIAEFGLRHGLYAIGDKILEVVVPKQDRTTAGRYLDRRGGDGGYMVLLQVDDVDATAAEVTEKGFRIVFRATGEGITGVHLHPKDVGGAILSLDQADPPESWGWAGTDWPYHVRSQVVTDMVAAEMQGPDPAELAQRWSRVTGHAAVESDGVWTIQLDGDTSLRFVAETDDRGEGLCAVDVVAADRSRAGETINLCGTRFNLV